MVPVHGRDHFNYGKLKKRTNMDNLRGSLIWKYLKIFLKYYVLPFFVLSFVCVVFTMAAGDELLSAFGSVLLMSAGLWGWYKLNSSKLDDRVWKFSASAFLGYAVLEVISAAVSSGEFFGFIPDDTVIGYAFPLLPLNILFTLMMRKPLHHLTVFLMYLSNALISYFFVRKKELRKGLICVLSAAVLSASFGVIMYLNSPGRKYSGHGFKYMHGWSSTDFSDYLPYSNPSSLVILDHDASYMIEEEKNFPVLDGAEACYPMYSSFAKNVYRNIGEIEKAVSETKYEYTNGKYVSFTNSSSGYNRLLMKEVDIFFGARPSGGILKEAEYYHEEFVLTPIAKEAFVFFAEDKNPVNDLSSEDIKKIYSGEITNWKDAGGKNQEIVAFQRPEESGSQVMMKYFMGDVPLKEPKTYEVYSSMAGIIDRVAEYHNEAGALGYTFRYFLEGLHQEDRVKMLSVDGVYPSAENIQNGSYPFTTYVYAVTLKSNEDPYVHQFIDYILSEEGQSIVYQSGYSPVNP